MVVERVDLRSDAIRHHFKHVGCRPDAIQLREVDVLMRCADEGLAAERAESRTGETVGCRIGSEDQPDGHGRSKRSNFRCQPVQGGVRLLAQAKPDLQLHAERPGLGGGLAQRVDGRVVGQGQVHAQMIEVQRLEAFDFVGRQPGVL